MITFKNRCLALAEKHEATGLGNFSQVFRETGMRVAVLRIDSELDEVKDLIKVEKQVANITLTKEIDSRLMDIAHYAIATVVGRSEVKYKRSEMYPENKEEGKPADASEEKEMEEENNKMFEMQGFIDDPISDEEWAAMEKYPPVPLSEYQDIEKQALDDYKNAIENRPGYPSMVDPATLDRYLNVVKELIVDNINWHKVFPFEVVADDLFMFRTKNRRRIEGDYIVVCK